jgi:hypothetical protein
MAEQKRSRRASKREGTAESQGPKQGLKGNPEELVEGNPEDVADQDPVAEQSQQAQTERPTVSSELRQVVREAAIEVLSPVARKATTTAAKYAVAKGPGLVKDKVVPGVDAAGGPVELAKKAGGGAGMLLSKLPKVGGDRGGAPSGTGGGRWRRPTTSSPSSRTSRSSCTASSAWSRRTTRT